MPRFHRPLHAALRPARSRVVLALLSLAFFWPYAAAAAAEAVAPRLGIEVLLDQRLDLLRGKRVGLVTNATGLDSQLRSNVDRFATHPDVTLVALFGPEHGVRGDVQAGDKVASSRDAATGLPVHSLYGEHIGSILGEELAAGRRPTERDSVLYRGPSPVAGRPRPRTSFRLG